MIFGISEGPCRRGEGGEIERERERAKKEVRERRRNLGDDRGIWVCLNFFLPPSQFARIYTSPNSITLALMLI